MKILVSSKGEASVKHYFRMGIYTKLQKIVQKGRPVWKHSEGSGYLFYGKLKIVDMIDFHFPFLLMFEGGPVSSVVIKPSCMLSTLDAFISTH